jgi:hypothetical protein
MIILATARLPQVTIGTLIEVNGRIEHRSIDLQLKRMEAKWREQKSNLPEFCVGDSQKQNAGG